MKKTIKLVISIIAVSALILTMFVGCGGNESPQSEQTPASEQSAPDEAAAPAETVVLRMAHNNPETGLTGQQYSAFAEFVEEMGDGSVKVDVYPGGSLIGMSEAFDAVIDGTVDMIHTIVAIDSGFIKDVAPLEVPGYYTGDDWVSFAATIKEPLEDIYADYGIKFLAATYDGTGTFVSRSEEIATPADLEGMAVRAIGANTSKAIKMWGGAPTTMAMNDVPTALERGTVDSAYASWTVAVPFKLYEVVDQFTFTNITNTFACLLMNMDAWESLTPEQQANLEAAADKFTENSYALASDMFEKSIEVVKESGTNIHMMTKEEEAQFVDSLDPLWDEVSENCTDKGKALIELLKSIN